MESMAPWIVLVAYCLVTWLVTPRKVNQDQFFDGRSNAGSAPGVWLVAMSAAITWIFAKSIANASDLSFVFGLPQQSELHGSLWSHHRRMFASQSVQWRICISDKIC